MRFNPDDCDNKASIQESNTRFPSMFKVQLSTPQWTVILDKEQGLLKEVSYWNRSKSLSVELKQEYLLSKGAEAVYETKSFGNAWQKKFFIYSGVVEVCIHTFFSPDSDFIFDNKVCIDRLNDHKGYIT
mmetsp:Transcript_43889/g.42415  ORF Transcript_43889/g.42415 Transcript_43889/m.42415 type:complete len:129 (-) Transcript_43889:174-560(-)